MLSHCFYGRFWNALEQRPFAYGADGSQTAVVLKHAKAAELAFGLPSPADAFRRPQAPIPPHPNDASRERPPADGMGAILGRNSVNRQAIFSRSLS